MGNGAHSTNQYVLAQCLPVIKIQLLRPLPPTRAHTAPDTGGFISDNHRCECLFGRTEDFAIACYFGTWTDRFQRVVR